MVSVQQLQDFILQLDNMIAAHFALHYKNLQPSTFTFEVGKKFARIVRVEGPDNRSAYAFIDMGSGAILKPDGWKRPAKHARGNLTDANPLACCGPHGVAYLR